LKALTKHDVVVPVTRARDVVAIKKAVDVALRKIGSVCDVRFPKARAYFRRKTCANSQAAESHIEELLASVTK